jgi:hypothetical protein
MNRWKRIGLCEVPLLLWVGGFMSSAPLKRRPRQGLRELFPRSYAVGARGWVQYLLLAVGALTNSRMG